MTPPLVAAETDVPAREATTAPSPPAVQPAIAGETLHHAASPADPQGLPSFEATAAALPPAPAPASVSETPESSLAASGVSAAPAAVFAPAPFAVPPEAAANVAMQGAGAGGLAPPVGAAAGAPPTGGLSRWAVAALMLAGVSTFASITLWQRLSTVQEQLARQNLDASNQAYQASSLAKQSQEQAGDASTRIAMLEGRVTELASQRQQIDALLQAASRSTDDSLLADLESSLRMAQEQAQLTGSASPLVAALQSAQRRLASSTVPGAARVQRAMASDIQRIKAAPRTDVSMSLAQIEELARQVEQLPSWHDQGRVSRDVDHEPLTQPGTGASGWRAMLASAWQEVRGLVRVQTIDLPNGALLSSEQTRQLRLVMQQRLLSARMGLLARQPEAVRADLVAVSDLLERHFDPNARQSLRMKQELESLRTSVAEFQLPRIDDSLTTLAQVLATGG